MTSRFTGVLIVLAAVGTSARAGVVVTAKGSNGSQSTLYVDAKKLRFENSERRAGTAIFDSEARKLIHIDPEARTYTEVTEADAKAMSSHMQEAMENAKASMSPEQRAQFEAMMAQRQPAQPRPTHDVKFEANGSHETVAGFGCDGYRVLRDGKVAQEGCFIPWSAGAIKKEDIGAFVEMGKFLQEMMANAFGGARPVGGQGPESRIFEFLEKAPGFPASMSRVGPEGERTSSWQVTSIKRTQVSADQFTVPAGYTKVDPMKEGGRRHRE